MDYQKTVDVRLRCLEIANKWAFNREEVLPIAQQYETFCTTGKIGDSNVLTMPSRSR